MDAGSFLNIAKAIVMIFGGCMSNVYTLEVLTREDKGCGNLVTFSHMVAISCFAAIENFNWSTFQFKARKIGIQYYMRLVVMFFVVQIANNKAFAFNISLPLHLVFRSGSLMASMLVGAFYLNRRYTRNSVSSIFQLPEVITLVTVGFRCYNGHWRNFCSNICFESYFCCGWQGPSSRTRLDTFY